MTYYKYFILFPLEISDLNFQDADGEAKNMVNT